MAEQPGVTSGTVGGTHRDDLAEMVQRAIRDAKASVAAVGGGGS